MLSTRADFHCSLHGGRPQSLLQGGQGTRSRQHTPAARDAAGRRPCHAPSGLPVSCPTSRQRWQRQQQQQQQQQREAVSSDSGRHKVVAAIAAVGSSGQQQQEWVSSAIILELSKDAPDKPFCFHQLAHSCFVYLDKGRVQCT